MNEPTRDECERKFPQLKLDPLWRMLPVLGQDGDHIGFVCIHYVGARCFATPVFKAPVADVEVKQ